MSLPEAKVSDDFTETETLKSVLSHDNGSLVNVSTKWHPEEGKQRSEDIEKYLQAESSKLKRQIKVLVLGMMEPKDVFWKQTLLLENPLTESDREEMKPTIRNVVSGLARGVAHELLEELGRLKISETVKGETARMLEQVLEHEDDDLGRKLDELYRDSEFQRSIKELELSPKDTERKVLESQYSMFMDSSPNQSAPFVDLLSRVTAPDYKPTDHDYLHFDNRRKASYLREAQIHRDSHLLRILDLHSGRGERKKWIHFFEDTKCVVFMADLGTYGQCLMENDEASMMHESLMLFESVAMSKWFMETPMVCVLSNVGAFKRKLKDSPMSKWFPEYQGKTEDDAVEFMVERHRKVVEARKGVVEVHVCDEISSSAIESILDLMENLALKDCL